MDWLTPLQTFGTSYLYPALKLLSRLCYLVTIPLHYPLYYLLSLVVFLLSPIWYMLQAVSNGALAIVDLFPRLKYLYIYLACAAVIGICAGCVLHGTSSFIFVSLGVDTSRDQDSDYRRSNLGDISDDELDFDIPESGTRSEGSSGRLPRPSASSQRVKSKQEKDDAYEMFERQWEKLRPSDKPKRRRRGLLSQTIHEESSSDLT
ncbi:uncharacterized protein GGS22DRAFT_163102 [Annulohypoxylon maeteangense]|uniref:uncharacterized protein n=1 Tax=Annulohypoxylon maeteangense TaxID=1927788 RepID=UPI00200899C2|nr:uncharacterized protein GGS22DRAFT_163102 [Annulohypoxylon maeteangense]KAI0885208.1 hypothetical protein GGS22DRAFT_163102 [Annulohypoxylon maeteangense]